MTNLPADMGVSWHELLRLGSLDTDKSATCAVTGFPEKERKIINHQSIQSRFQGTTINRHIISDYNPHKLQEVPLINK